MVGPMQYDCHSFVAWYASLWSTFTHRLNPEGLDWKYRKPLSSEPHVHDYVITDQSAHTVRPEDYSSINTQVIVPRCEPLFYSSI